MKKIFLAQFADLSKQIELIVSELSEGVVYLYGDLGAGKTSFVRCFLEYLGWQGAVPSPTYNLINTYSVNNLEIMHSDLYRIAEPEELLYLDAPEWTEQYQLIFIEWPEKAAGFIPPADYKVYLEFAGSARYLSWERVAKFTQA